jgi:molybdate transport system substrate-binding protein
VPAGQYGKEALMNLDLWARVEASVVQSENVRAALKLVEIGEAPLGIVYASDAIAGQGVTVVGTFPEGSHTPIVYPAALTVTSVTDAQGFLDYLETPAAEAVFLAQGFQVLP